MSEKYAAKLQELNKLIKQEISIIENGGKLSSFKREIKPREKQLKQDLIELVRDIAKTGQIKAELWPDVRNFLIVFIKEVLDNYQAKYADAKTFQEEKEVILQYIVFFEKPPFTLQRMAELSLEPDRFYRSSKKILYAFEKLVNVGDPDER